MHPSNHILKDSMGTSSSHNRYIQEDIPVGLRSEDANESIGRYRNTSTPRRAVLSVYFHFGRDG